MAAVVEMLSLLLVVLLVRMTVGFQCMDERGQPVDWFAVYKLPRLDRGNDQLLKNGTAYLYMDAKDRQWQFSSRSLSVPGNCLAHTLAPVYKSSRRAFYVFYNDQFNNVSSTAGHTKGVVAFENDLGFWLIHSVPHFPPLKKYNWPRSATVFGQSALCVTFRTEELSKIGNQLYYNRPGVYKSYLPTTFSSRFPVLNNVIRGVLKSQPPYENKEILISRDGEKFTSFAKSGKWNKELYRDYVANNLKSGLFTETWRKGTSKNFLSSCKSTYPVYNVEKIKLVKDIQFSTTQDHSKWAVSTQVTGSWVCIGDINRQEGQLRRGGGTLCMKNKTVWKQYHGAIQDYEKCSTGQ